MQPIRIGETRGDNMPIETLFLQSKATGNFIDCEVLGRTSNSEIKADWNCDYDCDNDCACACWDCRS